MLVQDVTSAEAIGEATIEIGPLSIKKLGLPEAVQYLRSAVLSRSRLSIAICNAHTVMTALDDPDYLETLNRMTLLNDGVGMALASKYLHGESFPANLNGTDLIPHILAEIGTPLRIYLLGAKEEQVQLAKAHIEKTYPAHEVVGVRNGYFDVEDCAEVCAQVSAARPDLLLVAMGNPRQEKFIMENRAKLNATIAVGVGALFDFMSGNVVRAPKAVQAVGLEWLFRFLQEPRRLFQRYVVGIPRFFLAVRKLKRAQTS
ncbi:WecB/TagA/CpsF family glycosyltransferase [Roseibium sp.]|uniref:WecB/TagA/CpsF family glycosyltransferase n=1 Tax=Roseibium sp. TaxID=1936156 RepID=UPI0039EF82BD